MSKYGFLSVLKEEMDKHFHYDYALDWNKKNHVVELSFVLEVQNADSVETIDDKGEVSNEDIIFEDYVLFYNPAKSKFDADDYLVTVPYDPKKGLSREYLAYFAQTLNDVAIQGLDDLMDFLTDETATDFSLEWDTETFDNGRAELEETEYYGYPRY
ncbi:DUF3013 family protein [Streptococcus mutans]|jgi:hypothetical protein|uniref:DUF3013 family protein n=1 Tax=Streptococcus mutans TaxID=1309 RepID=UPI0018997B7B|nr:DUF3013 family protein [Streptococcus mutans]MCB4949628.1 DUF3013 family protein [Streptococcus mutans]MCB4960788.1 DUF3013 family protein [Streptococcus mutans]MCB5000924.1 DUF3013 family protein [Streptococcus mutans]MCB5078394.1 DUF3013 family protein [Streptococcus mutans]MCB5128040.1 DUF3013 family protein [Streptococcus mutans]